MVEVDLGLTLFLGDILFRLTFFVLTFVPGNHFLVVSFVPVDHFCCGLLREMLRKMQKGNALDVLVFVYGHACG